MPEDVRCYVLARSVDFDLVKSKIRNEAPEALVQTASCKVASNESFIEMIAAQTLQARASGNLLAKKAEIDLLLRLGGTTQISTAVDAVGAAKGEPCLLIVASEPKIVDALEKSVIRSARRLPSRTLSKEEMTSVEVAALLNAVRA